MSDPKGNGPDAANDRPVKDQTKYATSIAPSSHDVNEDQRRNALRLSSEAEEQARWKLIRRNRAIADRIVKYSLGKDGKLPSVNRLESSLGRMAFEFPYTGGARVTPRTIMGTLIGHDSETFVTLDSMREAFIKKTSRPQTRLEACINIAKFKLNTAARHREYTIDEAAIDRRYLFESQFLFNPEELEKMLMPRCLTARFDYAARLHLTLHRLGISRPRSGHMRNALSRVEEWARLNSGQLPDWLSPSKGGCSMSTTQLPAWLTAAPFETTLATRLRSSNIPQTMREARRWLVHRTKVPFYVSGAARSGTLDSPEDLAQMGTFEQALAAVQAGGFDGVGFALGGGWQGIDLDKVEDNGLAHLVPNLPGYVERSPSGKGWHAIGFGAAFDSLAPDGSGLEAYSGRRYFTVTGHEGRGQPVCLAQFVREGVAPLRRQRADPASPAPCSPRDAVHADWVEVYSALSAISPSCSRDDWIKVGMALHRAGGDAGDPTHAFDVWNSWSTGDPLKYPGEAQMLAQWRSFKDDKATGVTLGTLFKLARDAGWEKPLPDVSGLFGPTGGDALATPPSAAPRALSIVFADSLSEDFQPPDELIQGLITVGDCSLWYGDSNAGKTFVLLDAACAVARGVPWMGRQTEQGLVVYLAAESPASVRGRLQAYQKHHGVRVPNFVIVQSPIDLFAGEFDTDAVIHLIGDLEAQTGQRCRLIVGDTLARLSAGANENAGQDMGLVVRRIDRIRSECKAHMALIHHSGKQAANGARGWSGLRAAVDTEIEVTDSPTGRCLEVTKQRDLPTKGQRIGFNLHVLTLGVSKWGAAVTSCVALPSVAPVKQQGKPLADSAKAVIRVMREHPNGIMRKDLVRALENEFTRTTVTRGVDRLILDGTLRNIEGIIHPSNLFPVLQVEGCYPMGVT